MSLNKDVVNANVPLIEVKDDIEDDEVLVLDDYTLKRSFEGEDDCMNGETSYSTVHI